MKTKVLITIVMLGVSAFGGYQVATLMLVPLPYNADKARTVHWKSPDGKFEAKLLTATKTHWGGHVEWCYELTVSRSSGRKISHDTGDIDEADFYFDHGVLAWSQDGKELTLSLGKKTLDIKLE